MVRVTSRADTGRLGPPHQEPDSLLRTETGVEDHDEGLPGAVLGVPGGRRRPRGPCRPYWLWSLRSLASRPNQTDIYPHRDATGALTKTSLLRECEHRRRTRTPLILSRSPTFTTAAGEASARRPRLRSRSSA